MSSINLDALMLEMKSSKDFDVVISPRSSMSLRNANEESPDFKNCLSTLRLTPWFMNCSEKNLIKVARKT